MTATDRLSLRLLQAALCAIVLGAMPFAASAQANEASGKWTVDGQTIELDVRTFVLREADPFGKGTNPCLLVSNEKVPDEAVPDDDEGIAALLDRMRDGGLRALQVCFESNGAKLRNVNDVVVFHPGISPGRFALQGYHKLAATFGQGRIAGKLQGNGETDSGGAWSDEIDLAFLVPPG